MLKKTPKFWAYLFQRVLDYPKRVLVLTAGLCLATSIPIAELTLDPTVEALIDTKSTVAHDFNRFQKAFGNDELVIVSFAYENVLSKQFLGFVGDLTDKLRLDPAVGTVDSLSHAVRIRSQGEELSVSELFRPLPDDESELAMRRIEALENKMYMGDLLNKDLTASSLLIRLKSVPELAGPSAEAMAELDPALRAELEKNRPDPLKIRNDLVASIAPMIEQGSHSYFPEERPSFYTAGFFITSKAIEKSITRDNLIFVPLTIFVLILLLFFAFRSWVGVVLPFAIVVLTLIPAIGLMAMSGIPLTMVNSFLPVVLMIIALADAIHVLVKYFEELSHSMSKRIALENALRKIYKPCLYTSLTTMVGFLSLLYSDVPPVGHFGVFAAIGCFIAFILTVTLLPAILILLPRPNPKVISYNGRWLDRILEGIVSLNVKYPKHILVGSGLLMVAAIISLNNLNIETVLTKFYKEDSKLIQDLNFIDDELAGTQTIEILLEALNSEGVNYSDVNEAQAKQKVFDETKDKFLTAQMQNRIEEFETFLLADANIKKVLSVTDLTKSTQAAFVKEGEQKYTIPQSDDKIGNYLFLLSNSAEPRLMKTFATSGYNKARLAVRMRSTGTGVLRESINRIKERQDYFGKDVAMTITGTTVMSAAIADNFLFNQIISFSVALVFVILLIIWIFGSPIVGALALIPNLFPILIGFLVMYISDIDLNVNTVMVASIAIGLVVDDTIHFFYRLIQESKTADTVEEAVTTTVRTVGRALGFTSFVLVGGFSILTFSDFQGTAWLGMLLAVVILWALLSDLVLTAVVVMVTKPNLKRLVDRGPKAKIKTTRPQVASMIASYTGEYNNQINKGSK